MRAAILAMLLLACSAAHSQTTIVERRVAASTDDAEESAGGSIDLTSSDLELVYDGSNQFVGMRWTNVTVPQGALIAAAWIQFTADEAQSEATHVLIAGQLTPNATTFTSTSLGISTRPQTSAGEWWDPPAWTSGQAGAAQRTPDLKRLVQEIVDQGAWVSGNALVMVIEGAGHRTAESYDGSATSAALLHIEWTDYTPTVGCDVPPFFPADWSDPTCLAGDQPTKCRCSECMTWDPVVHPGLQDYEVVRRVAGTTSWQTVGTTPGLQWCFAKDGTGLPTENSLYDYAVRACAVVDGNRVCSTNYSTPVQYRAAQYWDLVHP